MAWAHLHGNWPEFTIAPEVQEQQISDGSQLRAWSSVILHFEVFQCRDTYVFGAQLHYLGLNCIQ